MSRRLTTDLPHGAQFTYPHGGTVYEVVVSGFDNADGSVEVKSVGVPDAEYHIWTVAFEVEQVTR